MTGQGEPGLPLEGTVREVAPILLERVTDRASRRLWRELVGRYHYLGHAVPFGAHLRYLVYASRPERTVVGCVQVSSPAWHEYWKFHEKQEKKRNHEARYQGGAIPEVVVPNPSPTGRPRFRVVK